MLSCKRIENGTVVCVLECARSDASQRSALTLTYRGNEGDPGIRTQDPRVAKKQRLDEVPPRPAHGPVRSTAAAP